MGRALDDIGRRDRPGLLDVPLDVSLGRTVQREPGSEAQGAVEHGARHRGRDAPLVATEDDGNTGAFGVRVTQRLRLAGERRRGDDAREREYTGGKDGSGGKYCDEV